MALDWGRAGLAWPHREASSFVQAGGLRWHVQRVGAGPVALLIHGTGSSTHSWRALMPILAQHFTVVAMDLPGHAFTGTPAAAAQLSLPGMVASLAEALALDVALVVGHSAGAAIAARMVLDGQIAPSALVSINGALLPLAGLPGLLFPPTARLMASSSLIPQLFARRNWDRRAVERLIAGTGSTIDAQGLALYGLLLRDAAHAAGALGMMARWDLKPLASDLARLHTPLTLLVGSNDKAVPPPDARRVRARLPADNAGSVHVLSGGGHLVHEERAGEVAAHVVRCAFTQPA
ncbi:MAG: alpha/beta fold hydrolase BchO [Ideonella sp.]